MKKSKSSTRITTVIATLCILMLMTSKVFATTKEIVIDGTFQSSGFINAGEVVGDAIEGPGNWTQLNLGDVSIDEPYLHIIMKATGETEAAQIVVSDRYTVNLADLGIRLSEEYQDVVLPVGEQDIDMLSWLNFMGLDGGGSIYSIKDIFLSDSSEPTLTVASADELNLEEILTEEADAPKTGDTSGMAIVSLIGIMGCVIVLVRLKKFKEA